jgi:hypothetical protein
MRQIYAGQWFFSGDFIPCRTVIFFGNESKCIILMAEILGIFTDLRIKEQPFDIHDF